MQKIILFVVLFMITTIIYSQNPCPGVPTVSYQGKTYNTVQIGTQCWLKENLDIGTWIQSTQEQTNNGIIEKYCYNNDQNNCTTYGALYRWAEAVQYKNGATNTTSPNPVFSGNVQGICPSGWHIPTTSEFLILDHSANSSSKALLAVCQGTGDGAGTNTSGFSALLAGFNKNTLSIYWFDALGERTYMWSSTESSGNQVYSLYLYGGNNSPSFSIYIKDYCYSVRCLKDGATAVEDTEEFPREYSLSQNYPNPFNPTTTINYSVPKTSFVTIKVYDELGKEVATIINDNESAGNHRAEFNASKLVSGIYFYTIQAGDFTQTKKMILMK